MKNIITLMLFLALYNSYSQNSIEGSIKDANNLEAIVYASIYIPQLEKGTTSDENGNFIISNIPNGNYKIVISYVGYETISQTINIPQTTPLSITLKPTAIEMEEIIISTPFHKLQSENVMKVERQSLKTLKNKGAVTLSDGISNIAGVENISTGTGIGKPVIRGLSSNRVLVYTQGVRLENQQFGEEHGLGVNDNGIESVEVIKGPSSLLYGSDALGGVLYINPEKFANQNESEGQISGNYYSNTKGYNTSAGYKASGEKFKFLFRGSLTEHADYDTKDYRVTNTRYQEKDFKAGLGYQSSNFKTEFRYNINNSKIGIPEEIGLQSTNTSPMLPYQNLTNHIFSSKSKLFFDNSSLDLTLGYIYNDRKEFEDEHHHHDHDQEDHEDEHEEHHEEEFPALHMKLKTFNYDLKYHLPKYGKFETIVGVQGMYQTNTNYGEEQLIPNATTNDIGVMATSHIHFENLDVQLGARFDNRTLTLEQGFSKHYNSFNGALGFKTNIVNNLTARLNIASGFRAPNLAELTSDGVHHGSNRYEIGNSDLENEQNIQLDVNLEYKNKHLEFFVNGFYNHIDNYIFLSPDGTEIGNTPVYYYIQDNAKLYGGEIGLHLHPHPIHWLHLESSFETVTGKQNNDDYLPLIPANSLSNTLRAEFETKWLNNGFAFVRLRSTFKQNNVSEFETNTDGYNLLSAGIGGTIKLLNKNLDINLSATNLTNETYINHLSRLKSNGIYNMGRNISLGLTYTL